MLDVVIIGAGLAGLSASISLRRAGHKVRIYEGSSFEQEIGAALNITPNTARFLMRWGLDPKASDFVKAGTILTQDAVTMEITSTESHADNEDLYDANLWYAHRVDLHSTLRKMATGSTGPGVPVVIHLNSSVARYDPDLPAAYLENGEEIRADLIVGADGIRSIARQVVFGRENPPVPPTCHNMFYRFLIPAEALEEDPETKFWTEENVDGLIRIMLDERSNRTLTTYPCRNNTIHNFMGYTWENNIDPAAREDFEAKLDKAQLVEKFSGLHPSLMAVINKATDVRRWPLWYHPPAPTWRKGKMVLAGDAAHPVLPQQGQGGAMALEDGLALGIVMSGATDASDVEKLLEMYEKIRRNRASAIQILSNVGKDGLLYDENELSKFMSKEHIPKTLKEFYTYDFEYDVADEAIKTMEEFDPSFHVPHDFFEDDSFNMSLISEELSKMCGFITVETCISVETEETIL
ncbi:FAD binding domain-containing protein [Colletotrichum graminicola]|uniref:FAD binding domain-containing protein n=1 Tax=Colletotrichum graminicola (strain M1.001 / M2 / FGSC 10212) TaxID=645133 RepID=E3Q5B8_COLGM|nr:FAD binding domain-containing protein [Colletotrichum graminicola M1.001]EFQ25885.1 FAD binding domain-containing protein [Colletotrichum graminicola M1.001]WDK22999.1 FAD binding domain-containing protein [Colletotrichum graminicola]